MRRYILAQMMHLAPQLLHKLRKSIMENTEDNGSFEQGYSVISELYTIEIPSITSLGQLDQGEQLNERTS